VASTHDLVLALAGAACWGTWSAGCGYAAHRLPPARLEQDGRLLRLRRWEAGGQAYARWLRIKAWKDLLPEAGALFRGGFSKRRVERHDRAYLEGFLVATRRAELAHWPILAAAPAFLVWIPLFDAPWWLAVALAAYGIVANVPCIAVQRYNRGRLERILSPRTTAGSAA
jgi:glycosyl-4,4'-diaponeurosporenoate acyltransferase